MSGFGSSVDSENISVIVKENCENQIPKTRGRKSLIPVLTPPSGKGRKPLTPIQAAGSGSKNEMVGRRPSLSAQTKGTPTTASSPKSSKGISKSAVTSSTVKSGGSSTTTASKKKNGTSTGNNSNALSKVRSGFVEKKKAEKKSFVDAGVQVGSHDYDEAQALLSDEPPMEYYRDLAEERQKTVEELSQKVFDLSERCCKLETENELLEKMLEEAKVIAEMVTELGVEADESGFVGDSSLAPEDDEDD